MPWTSRERALAKLEEKAEKAGLLGVIETWKCEANDIGQLPAVDFGLSCYMAHETPDIDMYFKRMAQCIRPGGKLLLIEPKFHVSRSHFKDELVAAGRAGFVQAGAPRILGSLTATLERT